MEPWNVQSRPIVGLISYPSRWYVSIVWALRRLDDTIAKSDTITTGNENEYKLGYDDAHLIREALASKKLWAFSGGSFHFTISNIPIVTVLSLAILKIGNVVLQAPDKVRFDSVVSPIGISKSSVYTLGTVLEKLSDMHRQLIDSGAHPFQLMELVPCGSVVDCEYMITGTELLQLIYSILCHREVSRCDLLIDNVVLQMKHVVKHVFPVVFSGVGECSSCLKKCEEVV